MQFQRKIHGKPKSRVAVLFPHWKSRPFMYAHLIRVLSKHVQVLEYHYTPDILTSDVEQTIQNFQQIGEDAVQWIGSLKHRSVGVLGFSIGSFLAFQLAARSSSVNKVIAVTACDSFTDFFWDGNATRKMKAELQSKGYDKKRLDKEWHVLSPQPISKKTLLFLAAKDKTIPIESGKRLLNRLKNTEVRIVDRSHAGIISCLLMKVAPLKEFLT
ncbi:MAG: hypothetical protein ABIH34_06875 [Nanoarchaeota archaeon]